MPSKTTSNIGDAIKDYIHDKLIGAQTQVNIDNLDLLADAITGIENFYQTILEESVAPDIGLQVGAQSMTQLGYPPREGPSYEKRDTHISNMM